MAAPLPTPLPKWAKTLLRVQSWLVPAFATQLVDYEGLIGDVVANSNNQWRRFVLSFAPLASTENADVAYTTFDIVNITAGAVDNTWTTADYSSVGAEISKVLGPYLTNFMSVDARYTGFKAYRMAFTALPSAPLQPGEVDKPFAITGPPENVTPGNTPGSIAGHMAPQVALSTTDKVPYPRHWGRNYWPYLGSQLGTGTTWQLNALAVDNMANAMHAFYDGLMAKEFFPVVPVTQVNKQPARALLTVSEVQVDSNLDVIRRRRQKTTAYRKSLGV